MASHSPALVIVEDENNSGASTPSGLLFFFFMKFCLFICNFFLGKQAKTLTPLPPMLLKSDSSEDVFPQAEPMAEKTAQKEKKAESRAKLQRAKRFRNSYR